MPEGTAHINVTDEDTVLLVTGSRSIETSAPVDEAIEGVDKDFNTILHGGASGVDQRAGVYAVLNGYREVKCRPDYDKYGRRAPLVRNDQMVEVADCVVAIWDGESEGTRYTIDAALDNNVDLNVRIVE